VKTYLAFQGLPQKDMLLVDNAACHLDCSFTNDNFIVVKLLFPTSIICSSASTAHTLLDPLVEGYLWCLLSDSSSTPYYLDFIKKVKIKDCIYLIAEAWDKTQHYSKLGISLLRQTLPSGSIKYHDESPPAELPIPDELSAVIAEWETSDKNPEYEQLCDEAIVQPLRRLESPEEEDDNKRHWIYHLDASKTFQVRISWVHQQSEGEPSQILYLRRLKRFAHSKHSNILNQTYLKVFLMLTRRFELSKDTCYAWSYEVWINEVPL